MAKDRESRSGKVAPGGGESKSPKHKDKENRKSRKAWPGEEPGQSSSSSSKSRDKQSPKASEGYNKDRDRGRRHKDKGKDKGGGGGQRSPRPGGDDNKGKPFRPTANQRGPRKSGAGLDARACLGMANNVYIQRPDAKEAVKALCLNQRQLKYLKKKFDEVDVDGSGTMDSTDGTIEFDEFVAVLLTYCMYSKDDILRFCFDTYDRDHSNSIDEQEFMALLSSVNNGTPMFPGNFTTVLQNFDSNDDGIIDFQEFKVIEQRYPLIFFPAFRLQEQMQKCTLGTSNWRNIHIAVNRQGSKRERTSQLQRLLSRPFSTRFG
ncbi:hypothetical protein JL721_2983 [Aureococcus anophagefferens]|nr:hypothetical protein JL721_2983 [Aureococcus anophagefferens]